MYNLMFVELKEMAWKIMEEMLPYRACNQDTIGGPDLIKINFLIQSENL